MSIALVGIETKFQRDLNRTRDNDRNTRKSGLQKLLKELPWNNSKERDELINYVSNSVLASLLITLSDPVEKCRELTLLILKEILKIVKWTDHVKSMELAHTLCDRINELPFQEPAEELRLLVVELLQTLFASQQQFVSNLSTTSPFVEKILNAMTKSLHDTFPKVKNACAELVTLSARCSPLSVRAHFRQLLKGLALNAMHQHSKTRSLALQAIGAGLASLGTEEYVSLMKDTVLHLFGKVVADRTPSVRIELSGICASIMAHRIQYCRTTGAALVKMDLELVALLLLLTGDEQEEVAAQAKAHLAAGIAQWTPGVLLEVESSMGFFDENSHIVDGEATLASLTADDNVEVVPINSRSGRSARTEDFVQANLKELVGILVVGVESWTVEAKKRSLRGLERLIGFAEDKIESLLPVLLNALSVQIRDDEPEIRNVVDQCCERLGAQCLRRDLLDILLPRVNGEVPGGDTFTQRTNAVRVLTSVLKGFPSNTAQSDVVSGSEMDVADGTELTLSTAADHSARETLELLLLVGNSVANTAIYEFREAAIREAVLLLVRTVTQLYPDQCLSSLKLQQCLVVSLVYLCGRCPGEDDVVRDFALKELTRLAALHSADSKAAKTGSAETNEAQVEFLLAVHYDHLLAVVARSNGASSSGGSNPNWESQSPAKSAFEVLVRLCPTETWIKHSVVIPIISAQVQPKTGPAAGSAEANAISYAAQRGDEVITTTLDVDVRLSLLALLEGLIRAGAAGWECGRHISAASESIIKEILMPNLIWRIGKVEATIRKVALVATHALLKAGAVHPDTLFKVAPHLVPLLVSHLDDSELSPRQITCLCLTVVFERLRGAFGEQSVREIYPKLLARLDDSNDSVRIAVCGSLNMFLQCAPVSSYSGTTIDYTLDQLFVHLDDPDPAIQQAVAQVIITASRLDKELVLRKAASSRTSHRSPVLCDKIVVEVQGFEILEDDDAIDMN